MKAVVRRACTADIDEICRIESASSASPWSRDSISHDVETNADAYVAVLCCGSCCNESSIEVNCPEENCPEESCREEGRKTAAPDIRICGYADMWMIAGEAQLNNIAVDADMRRRGYGRMLLEHMTDSCKRQGCSSMTLEVRRSNDAAISMYRSAGFTEAGIRPRYYLDNNEDAVIMDNKFD